ncbi:hypothetical protein [Xanthomonas maliensis]|uniref:hypothetical protein n=1 Tax=Xanthomonas maliensis TaxID=1321368 RepID=UPI0003B56988|nr:hypothetical protein [Xanthomonas maliensis]KAB7767612.1 hypothetical protein CKY51_11125 [Xanthomonas maliensis]
MHSRAGTYGLEGAKPAEPPVPTMPPAPQHRADVLVCSSFAALVRCGHALRMSRARAVTAANAATLRATDVNLVHELAAEDLAVEVGMPALLGGEAKEFRGYSDMIAWLQGREKVNTVPSACRARRPRHRSWHPSPRRPSPAPPRLATR